MPHQHELKVNSDSVEYIEEFGHDLERMVKRLKIPAAHAPKISNSFRLSGGYKQAGIHQSFQISDAHQAWRYGLVIVSADQDALEVCLEALIQWVGKQLD